MKNIIVLFTAFTSLMAMGQTKSEWLNNHNKMQNRFAEERKSRNTFYQGQHDSIKSSLAIKGKNKTDLQKITNSYQKSIMIDTILDTDTDTVLTNKATETNIDSSQILNGFQQPVQVANASENIVDLSSGTSKKNSLVKPNGINNKNTNHMGNPIKITPIKLEDLFVDPLQGKGFITSRFGIRNEPVILKVKRVKTPRMHYGLDIGAPIGTEVISSIAGKVTRSGWMPNGYGYQVVVSKDSVSVLCGHLGKDLRVRKGDSIQQKVVIGTVNSTGWSTGFHLHFGIMLNKKYVDPLKYLKRKK